MEWLGSKVTRDSDPYGTDKAVYEVVQLIESENDRPRFILRSVEDPSYEVSVYWDAVTPVWEAEIEGIDRWLI